MKTRSVYQRAFDASIHFEREIDGQLVVSGEAFCQALLKATPAFVPHDTVIVVHVLRDGGEPEILAREADRPFLEGLATADLAKRCRQGHFTTGDESDAPVKKHAKAWMLVPVRAKKDHAVALLILRRKGRFHRDELLAAQEYGHFLAQGFLNIRHRNRKISNIGEASRHEILLHTQASCFHEGESEGTISMERNWEAGCGSDLVRVWKGSDSSRLIVLCDLTANDVERQAGLLYVDTWFSLLAKTGLDVRTMLKRFNADMVRRRAECYASIVVMRHLPHKGIVEIAGCGDVGLVIFNHETMTVRSLSFGPAAGIGEDSEVPGSEIVVRDGDIICACSDGLYMARKKNGTLFGLEGVGEFIRKHYWLSSADLAKKIMEMLADKVDAAVNSDDISIQVLKILGD